MDSWAERPPLLPGVPSRTLVMIEDQVLALRIVVEMPFAAEGSSSRSYRLVGTESTRQAAVRRDTAGF